MDTIELTKKNARIAGLYYLGIIIFGMYSEFLVRGSLIDHSSAQNTLMLIENNLMQWRSGLVSDMVCQVFFLLLGLHLYRMLKHTNQSAARMMLLCIVLGVGVTFVNLLHHFAPVILLGSEMDLDSTKQASLMLFFIKLHGHGYTIAGVFFGLWLYPLGVMVRQSGVFPPVLGWLLMIGCFGYLIDTVVVFQIPSEPWITYPGLLVALVAEFGFCFYLLIIGIKSKRHEPTDT